MELLESLGSLDLIIPDIMIPPPNGYELVKQIYSIDRLDGSKLGGAQGALDAGLEFGFFKVLSS